MTKEQTLDKIIENIKNMPPESVEELRKLLMELFPEHYTNGVYNEKAK